MRLPSEREERLETIYNLHLEGKSSKEITHWMNEKYGTTLRSKKPYDQKLIWVTLDKYKKRLKRFDSYKIVHKSEKLCVISNKFRIVPPWYNQNTFIGKTIIINPGRGFGTGTHPTTILCLRWIEKKEEVKFD